MGRYRHYCHGRETPGKCSPDGHFKEYQYTREIAAAVVAHLQYRDYDAELLVPEFEDIPLKTRVKRENKIYDQAMAKHSSCPARPGISPVMLVSIHVNAAGMGDKWMNARGWCSFTYPGHTESDDIACYLYEAAEKHLPGHKLRMDLSDGDPDIEAPFYILKHTLTPAVLTENLFMDNREDCAFLLSDAGRRAIIALHVDGIVAYLNAEEPKGFK